MNNEQIVVKMALDAWNSHLSRTEKLFSELSDLQLQQEISPGKNSGIYLLGHLVAVHDAMLPLLGLGEKLYPSLYNIYVENPANAGLEEPLTEYLRKYWKEVHARLASAFEGMSTENWFGPHKSVSEEDFKLQPHRNKLNLVINRTNHLAYHLGQLVLLKK